MAEKETGVEVERMTASEFDARHRERYRAVGMGEKTLEQALKENDADWQLLKRTVRSGMAPQGEDHEACMWHWWCPKCGKAKSYPGPPAGPWKPMCQWDTRVKMERVYLSRVPSSAGGTEPDTAKLVEALRTIEDATRGSHADWHAHRMLARCNRLATEALAGFSVDAGKPEER